MTRRLALLFVMVLWAAWPNAAYSQDGDGELVEARRLRLWSAQTKNPDLVYSTYRRVDSLEGTGPTSWVYEWSQIGQYFADKGEELAASGQKEGARDAFLTASKFFGIARFPAKTLPGQDEAYLRHLQSYRRAGEFFEPKLVVIDIPFDSKSITGYLHLPRTSAKPPLILWNGGIDTWKGDVYDNIRPYVERGFAVLTFDVLGTGENSGWVAKPDSNALHSAVLKFMRTHPAIDGQHIAHVGFSFSGYYAARNSITEDGFFAVIAACGPVHEGWQKIYEGPWEIQEALSAAIHVPRSDRQRVYDTMQGFSLVAQGLLDGPDSVKVPTLIVNGDLDDLAPVSDLRLLAAAGRDTDLWIMGGDEHCFGQYRPIVMPKMADWLWHKYEAGKAAE
ncbi:MAG: esterase FrsA [Gammaproteobacteria bacterium]|nr:esterase FrsA [Gammaproteobacteria bacterium]MDH4255419.1 esterase FrsA [Gammaproteobacteria bacterium]MDH5310205.1 esterase FrsA [Gammaproteobacteria bacterium]